MTFIDFLMQFTSSSFRTRLKSIYLLFSNRFSFRAHRDYLYTDEHLKFVHILEAINYALVAELPPVFFEFGCHSGRTFSAAIRASNYLKIKDAQFFAFDSFKGLPATSKEQDGFFKQGTFATRSDDFFRLVYSQSGVRLNHNNVIKGFYDQSLTPELQKSMPKVGIVHIDVDLYSSTVDVLDFIKPLLVVGSVLIFDDWYCFSPGTNKGESRAFSEFCIANPSFAVAEWKNYSTFGKSFFVKILP